MFKSVLVCAAILAFCDAKITVPGLEDVKPTKLTDLPAIKTNFEKIIKVLSKSYSPYSVEGFDPIVVKSTDVVQPEYNIEELLTDLTIEGLANTKVVDFKISKTEKNHRTIVLEHKLTFKGEDKVTYKLNPVIVREGPISGAITGRTYFEYYVSTKVVNGKEYTTFGKQTLIKTELLHEPIFNEEEVKSFVDEPKTKAILDKIYANKLDYYGNIFGKVIEQALEVVFDDLRKFFAHTPTEEVVSKN